MASGQQRTVGTDFSVMWVPLALMYSSWFWWAWCGAGPSKLSWVGSRGPDTYILIPVTVCRLPLGRKGPSPEKDSSVPLWAILERTGNWGQSAARAPSSRGISPSLLKRGLGGTSQPSPYLGELLEHSQLSEPLSLCPPSATTVWDFCFINLQENLDRNISKNIHMLTNW